MAPLSHAQRLIFLVADPAVFVDVVVGDEASATVPVISLLRYPKI